MSKFCKDTKLNPDNLTAGHRKRLREKFMISKESLEDYEILEMLLFSAFLRKDTKNIAKRLLIKFNNNMYDVINADPDQLREVDEIGDVAIGCIKLIHEILLRMSKNNIKNTEINLSNMSSVKEYCKNKIGNLVHEEALVLFLNASSNLVAEQIINFGNADEVKIYKNIIITKATQNGATAIILVHNHPSGDATPSVADLILTKELKELLENVDMTLLDHIIVSKNNTNSILSNSILNFNNGVDKKNSKEKKEKNNTAKKKILISDNTPTNIKNNKKYLIDLPKVIIDNMPNYLLNKIVIKGK